MCTALLEVKVRPDIGEEEQKKKVFMKEYL